jgi:hypothetical protein
VPDPAGGVYLGKGSPPSLVHVDLSGNVTEIAPGGGGAGTVVAFRPVGLDSAGNLYVARRTFNGWQHFGCAQSTTFSVLEYTPASLASANPAGTDLSDLTLNGFWAWWAGSTAFVRGSADGAAAEVVSQITLNCPVGPFTDNSDQVLQMPAGGALTPVYQEDSPGPFEAPPDEGPLALAFDGQDHLFVASARQGTINQY